MRGVHVPVLTTDRLILRGHSRGDFADCAAMWADPAVVAGISGQPSSPADTWSRILRYRGLWAILGYGYWAVERRSDGAFVGDVGFADFHRECIPDVRGMMEAGWVLTTEAHGQGYATEAMAAAMAWSANIFPDLPKVCIISPDNRASQNVAAKLGFGPWRSGVLRSGETEAQARFYRVFS